MSNKSSNISSEMKIDAAKHKIMKRSDDRKRRSHHNHRHRNRQDEGYLYDEERSRHGDRHHRTGKKGRRRKSSRDSCRPRDVEDSLPQQIIHMQDTTLQLKSPSYDKARALESKSGSNQFIQPPVSTLSTRADVWLILSVTSVATLSSISLSSMTDVWSTNEKIVLITSSMLLAISTTVGCGYRYAPLRESLTQIPTRIFCLRSTKETLISVLSLFLAAVETSIVLMPSSYIAVSGNVVWNPNVFYSSWIGLYACFYLVSDLFTTNDSSGLVDHSVVSSRGYFDSKAKIWWMLLGSTTCLLVALVTLFSNSVCSAHLQSSGLCERAFGAVILTIFSLLLILVALLLHRLSIMGEMRRSPLECFNGPERANRMSHCLGGILSFAVFLLQAVSVAILTSPSGPGSQPNSIFLTSWCSFLLSLICLKVYIESSFYLPIMRSLPSHAITGAVKHNLDESFRTCGTIRTPVTDIDDSFKLTDDELEACIRHQTLEPTVPRNTIQVEAQPPETTKPLDSHDEPFYIKLVSQNEKRSRRAVEPSGVKAPSLSDVQQAKKVEPQVKSRDESLHPGPFIAPKHRMLKHDIGHAYVQVVDTPADPVTNNHRTQSPFMYPISAATESTEDCKVSQPEPDLNVLRRRASYSSVPSLQAVPEGSESSTRDKSKGSESTKTKKSKSLTSPSKVAESSKVYVCKIKRRGNGSLSDSTSNEYSISCDSKSIVTEITAETSDTPRAPPRKPDTNLENGSCATPRLNTLNSSVDDLVASAVFFARQSRLQKTSHNESRITMTTMSPNPSSSDTSSYPKYDHERSQSLLKRKESDDTNVDAGKAKRRKSINSLYSSNLGDIDAEGDFMC